MRIHSTVHLLLVKVREKDVDLHVSGIQYVATHGHPLISVPTPVLQCIVHINRLELRHTLSTSDRDEGRERVELRHSSLHRARVRVNSLY
jgi:hypothetical protein